MPASGIGFEHVTKEYDGQRVVDDVSLGVAAGSLAVILGPSGCGKTTLLRTVNRLVEPSAGRILIGDVDNASIQATALRRNIGYVIQHIGLFPHMTVAQNVSVVPSLLGWNRERIRDRVADMLSLVGLPLEHYGSRFPAALSGGQQQRVGLARALAADPPTLLMDEPFGALDAIERARLQGELIALQRKLRKTILFVTHDVDEALRLADSIVIMRDGRVLQSGRPITVLAKPNDAFVAELVNAHDLVRRFSVMCVRDVSLEPLAAGADGRNAQPAVGVDDDLRRVLAAMLESGNLHVTVVDPSGAALGLLALDRMLLAARAAAG